MFSQYKDFYQTCKANGMEVGPDPTKFYDKLWNDLGPEPFSNQTRALLSWESSWRSAARPYYNVYPGVVEMLLRLDISKIKVNQLPVPSGQPSLIVNLPAGNGLGADGRDILHLYLHVRGLKMEHIKGRRSGAFDDAVSFGVQTGEMVGPLPVWDIIYMPSDELTLQEAFEFSQLKSKSEDQDALSRQESESLYRVLSLAATLCLLGNNQDLIAPEVLSADKTRVTEQNLDALVAKSKRRGKFGWTVGASMEQVPHFRRPHPALYWTGVGREIPQIIWRSGALVHREKVAKIPTGFMDRDEEG